MPENLVQAKAATQSVERVSVDRTPDAEGTELPNLREVSPDPSGNRINPADVRATGVDTDFLFTTVYVGHSGASDRMSEYPADEMSNRDLDAVFAELAIKFDLPPNNGMAAHGLGSRVESE